MLFSKSKTNCHFPIFNVVNIDFGMMNFAPFNISGTQMKCHEGIIAKQKKDDISDYHTIYIYFMLHPYHSAALFRFRSMTGIVYSIFMNA